jgi:hypothetical protein
LRYPSPPQTERGIRQLWVLPAVRDVLDGTARPSGFPSQDADTVTHAFVRGLFLFVSLSGDRSKRRPDMERLAGDDDVWVMCFRKPPPGWRLFGCFAEKDVFVGVDIRDRHELRGRNYSVVAKAAFQTCEGLLHPREPLKGIDITDYLSGPIRNVDEPAI